MATIKMLGENGKYIRVNDNYSVVENGKRKYYHYKATAISVCEILGLNQIRSERTKQITVMLRQGECSCRRCGNELQGKKHCPLCGTFHYYTMSQ